MGPSSPDSTAPEVMLAVPPMTTSARVPEVSRATDVPMDTANMLRSPPAATRPSMLAPEDDTDSRANTEKEAVRGSALKGPSTPQLKVDAQYWSHTQPPRASQLPWPLQSDAGLHADADAARRLQSRTTTTAAVGLPPAAWDAGMGLTWGVKIGRW
jgi:hypothetical protein